MTEKFSGIQSLIFHNLTQKKLDEVAKDAVKSLELAGKKILELDETKEKLAEKESYIKVRNSSGGKGRAESFKPMKNKVTDVYNSLIDESSGKKPTFKALVNKLDKLYPNENWKMQTLIDWHKRLNKGLPL